jgi:hypothetical protein
MTNKMCSKCIMNTTEPTPLGIKSLTDKVRNLESVLSKSIDQIVPSVKTDIESFIDNLKKSKESTILKKMNEIKAHFEAGITSDLGGTNLSIIMSRVVQHTVMYIEKNIGTISKVLGETTTSALKLNTALSFIKGICPNIDFEEVINMINHFVEILFPSLSLDPPSTPLVTQAPVPAPASTQLVTVKRKKSIISKIFKKSS